MVDEISISVAKSLLNPEEPFFGFDIVSKGKNLRSLLDEIAVCQHDIHMYMRLNMSNHSTIEWTDATWNPVRGCTKISPGCVHCYAETFSERFRGVPGHPYEQGFDLRIVPEKLAEPLRWPKSKMVFVNSMSDLFHKGVPDDYRARRLYRRRHESNAGGKLAYFPGSYKAFRSPA